MVRHVSPSAAAVVVPDVGGRALPLAYCSSNVLNTTTVQQPPNKSSSTSAVSRLVQKMSKSYASYRQCPPAELPKKTTSNVVARRTDAASVAAHCNCKTFQKCDDSEEESGIEDYDEDLYNDYLVPSPTSLKNILWEWSIPYDDLEIGRQLRRGRRHDIHCGRWHGEVMVHIYHNNTEKERSRFWKKVNSLTMIRHENLALFMGVCMDMSQLAIVSSVRKGLSLHDHVHVNRDHFQLPAKVQIAVQVAQGMSYLHAKGIIHEKLNSKNIVLETKVKVCLLDQGMAQRDYDRNDYGCVPNGHLTYVSPEIMQTLQVRPPKVATKSPYTKASDVFAFGTVLYELLTEEWPFRGQAAHSIIYQVASGHLPSTLGMIKCPQRIKTLLSDCWMTDPSSRPNFHHILGVLQQNVLLQRRYSTSEPENLNRIGSDKTNL